MATPLRFFFLKYNTLATGCQEGKDKIQRKRQKTKDKKTEDRRGRAGGEKRQKIKDKKTEEGRGETEPKPWLAGMAYASDFVALPYGNGFAVVAYAKGFALLAYARGFAPLAYARGRLSPPPFRHTAKHKA
jgi:hypothetical protein